MTTVSKYHALQHLLVKFVWVFNQISVPQELLMEELHDYLGDSVRVLKSATAILEI